MSGESGGIDVAPGDQDDRSLLALTSVEKPHNLISFRRRVSSAVAA